MPAPNLRDKTVRRAKTPQRLLLPGRYRTPENKPEPHNNTHLNSTFVRASGLGSLPGTHMVDALNRVRGELGHPHLPFLPELPERGWRATTLARTLATLEGITAAGASYGWRLTHAGAPSRELALATATYASDLNALADVVGREAASYKTAPEGSMQSPPHPPVFKIQLTGPYTLAASVYLPNGERAISDRAALRDLRESLLAGLGESLKTVRQALDNRQARVCVQFDEPYLQRIIDGAIPTVSGFRRIPSIPAPKVLEGLGVCAQACAAYGAQPVINLLDSVCGAQTVGLKHSDVLRLAHVLDASFTSSESVTAHDVPGIIVDPQVTGTGAFMGTDPGDPRRFEHIAALLDEGVQVWLPVITDAPAADDAHTLWGTWREVGLGAKELNRITLTEHPRTGFTGESGSLVAATAAMARTAETAGLLTELANEK